jgi:ribosome biogenesis protein Tsr3
MAESIDNVFADEMYARAKKRAQQRVYDRKRCEKRRLERAKKISMKRTNNQYQQNLIGKSDRS